jgi:3-oxoacyl-[acyl-carrier-protein] synthase II
MRRVVVTGLGAITPLGTTVARTWSRLLAGDSGLSSVLERFPSDPRWAELTSTVAGLVPEGEEGWVADEWLDKSEQRRMSKFTQYALAAGEMALRDARLGSMSSETRDETGVCLGSGIGNLDEVYETSLAHHSGVRNIHHHHHNQDLLTHSGNRATRRYRRYSCPRS